jgi:pyruvate dehydrogenase E2 component (dihydrolipoamide acetyltransferase)
MADITMPRLSDTMEEGTIASWLKQPGDEVKKGDVLAQIETDKATMDLTAFESGTLQEILAPEGTTVAIGKPVARLGSGAPSGKPKADGAAKSAEATAPPAAEESDSETPKSKQQQENVAEAPEPSAETPAEKPKEEAEETILPAPPVEPETDPAATNGKLRASPVARHLAAEHGLDIAQIQGSGPQGRVIRADIEAALAAAPDARSDRDGQAADRDGQASDQPAATPASDGDERVPLSQMRRTIARRMAESTRTVPHFFLTTTVDAAELVKLRKQIVEQGVKVSFNDLVIKAVAAALRKMPEVNVSFAEDALIKHKHVNIGIAVATERGLIVPVLRDADQKPLSAIAAEARDLAERANAGKLQPQDYSDGTFTVSNLGMFGVEQFNAVINTPEAAILAVGAITREPAEFQDQIVLRERLKLTLSVDHRALDGAMGARYLQAVKEFLEKPLLLLV